MLALVAAEPAVHKDVIERHALHAAPGHAPALQLVEVLGHDGEQVGPGGEFAQVVHGGEECQRRLGLRRVAQHPAEVGAHLLVGERQQDQGAVVGRADALAVLAGEHGVLVPDVFEIVRTARDDQPAATGRRRFFFVLPWLVTGSFIRRQHAPELADERLRLRRFQVHDLLVEPVKDDHRALRLHGIDDLRGSEGGRPRPAPVVPDRGREDFRELRHRGAVAGQRNRAQIHEHRLGRRRVLGMQLVEPPRETLERGGLADAVFSQHRAERRLVRVSGGRPLLQKLQRVDAALARLERGGVDAFQVAQAVVGAAGVDEGLSERVVPGHPGEFPEFLVGDPDRRDGPGRSRRIGGRKILIQPLLDALSEQLREPTAQGA